MPDLPPRRAARTSGSRPILGRLTPAIKALLIAQAAIFAFFLIAIPLRPVMVARLALSPGLFAGEYWKLVTSLFLHLEPSRFLYCVLGIWWAGSDVERAQGTRRMLALFFVAGALANLAFAAASRSLLGDVMPFGGASFAVEALFVAFGRIYGRALVNLFGVFAVQARYIAIAFIGWDVVVALAAVNWPELAGIAAATLLGYLGATPGGLDGLWDALKLRRLRRRYRVIDGGAGRPPKKYVN
jgi:membrane associated rhomboid family serine protease